MTKSFIDSAYPPNDAQLAAAVANGHAGWNGYFAGPNILNGWSKADFDRVKRHGLSTMAYCSGWSPPADIRAQSAAWAVRTALDVEGGIRALIHPDDRAYLAAARPRLVVPAELRRASLTGAPYRLDSLAELKSASAWIQPWLDAAGSGQYGNYWVHPGVRAPFYVLAAYPTAGDPLDASWWTATARPGSLCGWQFHGSMPFAGMTIDLSWFDDALYAYLGGAAPKPPDPPAPQGDEDDMLYTSTKLHPLAATLKVDHAAAPTAVLTSYRDPSTLALPAGALADGAGVGVDGYVYSSSYIDADMGGGKIASDHVWWHATSGQWVPDALLFTLGVTGAPGPAVPAGEPIDLYLARRSELGGGPSLSLADVDAELNKVVAQLQITRKTQASGE